MSKKLGSIKFFMDLIFSIQMSYEFTQLYGISFQYKENFSFFSTSLTNRKNIMKDKKSKYLLKEYNLLNHSY